MLILGAWYHSDAICIFAKWIEQRSSARGSSSPQARVGINVLVVVAPVATVAFLSVFEVSFAVGHDVLIVEAMVAMVVVVVVLLIIIIVTTRGFSGAASSCGADAMGWPPSFFSPSYWCSTDKKTRRTFGVVWF